MDEYIVPQREGQEYLARTDVTPILDKSYVDVSSEEMPHLLDYWRVLLKRRWTILCCMLVVFATVAIGTFKQKPLFEGKVVMEINPEDPSVLNFKEILQVSAVDVDSYRETQYRILQSRTLVEQVIRDLKLYQYPEFYRKRILLGQFSINPDRIPSPNDPEPPDPSSDAFRNSVKNFMGLIDITPVRRSNLVEVSFFSTDPVLASRIANLLASDYIDQNLQVKWDMTVKASEWLETQLVGLKAKLEKSEDALQAYAQVNGILFVEEKQNITNARLEQLQTAYTQAQAERFQKEAQYSLVQAGMVQDLPGFLNNQLIQQMAVNLATAQQSYAELTSTVKPNYPKAVALKNQIDTLQKSLDDQKKALAQNIVDSYRSAVANEQYLAQALDEQKKIVNEIAEKSIQYNILKREVDTNKQLYDGLLERLKQSQVSAGLKASNIRVVDAAEVPKFPVRPRVVLNLALGFFLGVGLGIGLAFFQEYLDNTIKNSDEVEALLRLPSLGVVPVFALNGSNKTAGSKLTTLASVKALPPRGAAIQTHSEVLEAFRSLRTSILLSASPIPRIILITSALPGEGKTTMTVNLGATLASVGSRVLIIDCDMRRPACHHSVGVQNSPGLVQYLAGRVELSEAILPVPGVVNMSVIPCGPIPPNPAEVLSSPSAAELMRNLRSQFDYVLVDSPPLLSVADARILSTMTDAVVLVVRAYSTPYDVVRRARSLLLGAGARILGVALNDVDIHRDGYGYGSKGYYYGYGYGYGSGADEDSERDSRGDEA